MLLSSRLLALVALALGLLAFAGPTADSAIFSLGIAGQYTAYAIPIACRFLGGRPWAPGPFSLGRYVSAFSLCTRRLAERTRPNLRADPHPDRARPWPRSRSRGWCFRS